MQSSTRPERPLSAPRLGRSARPKPTPSDWLEPEAHRLAFADPEFLLRRETRGIRFQLEMLKPDLAQTEAKIEHTVVVFGSARFMDMASAQAQLEAAHCKAASAQDIAKAETAGAQCPALRKRPRFFAVGGPVLLMSARRRKAVHLHGWRPRHHGGGQPGRARSRCALGRPQHRLAPRTKAQPLRHARV